MGSRSCDCRGGEVEEDDIVPRHSLSLVQTTMSEDEMNIDDGEYIQLTNVHIWWENVSLAAGGAVRRRGRGFQNTSGALVGT